MLAIRFVCGRCGDQAAEFTGDGVCLPCGYEVAAKQGVVLAPDETLPGSRIVVQAIHAEALTDRDIAALYEAS